MAFRSARSAATSAIAARWPAVHSNGNSRSMRALISAVAVSGRRAKADLLLPTPSDDRQLQNEQLLKDEPPASAIELLLVLRRMDRRQCFGERHEVVLLRGVRRRRLLPARGAHFERERDHAPHLILREAFGERVERQQPHFGLVFFAVEPGDARVGHLPSAAAVTGFAGEEHVLAFAEFFAHERLVEPEGPEVIISLADEDADLALAEAAAAAIDFDDFAADRLRVFFVKIGDGAAVGEVFVVAREEEDEVGGVADIEPMEERGTLAGRCPG